MGRKAVYIGLCLCGMITFQACLHELLMNGAPGFVFGAGCGVIGTVLVLLAYRKWIGPID